MGRASAAALAFLIFAPLGPFLLTAVKILVLEAGEHLRRSGIGAVAGGLTKAEALVAAFVCGSAASSLVWRASAPARLK